MNKFIIILIICIGILGCAENTKNQDIQSSLSNDIIDTLTIEPYRHGVLTMGNKEFEIIGAKVFVNDSTYNEDFILISDVTIDMIKQAYNKNNGPFKVVVIYDPKSNMDKVIYNIVNE